jgi:hypothetical protein
VQAATWFKKFNEVAESHLIFDMGILGGWAEDLVIIRYTSNTIVL